MRSRLSVFCFQLSRVFVVCVCVVFVCVHSCTLPHSPPPAGKLCDDDVYVNVTIQQSIFEHIYTQNVIEWLKHWMGQWGKLVSIMCKIP